MRLRPRQLPYRPRLPRLRSRHSCSIRHHRRGRRLADDIRRVQRRRARARDRRSRRCCSQRSRCERRRIRLRPWCCLHRHSDGWCRRTRSARCCRRRCWCASFPLRIGGKSCRRRRWCARCCRSCARCCHRKRWSGHSRGAVRREPARGQGGDADNNFLHDV